VLKASKTFSGPCLVAQKILQGKLKTGSENTFPFVAIKRRVILLFFLNDWYRDVHAIE
jgi:hypothetical protein